MSFPQRAVPDPERRRPRGPWQPRHLDEVTGGAASFGVSGTPETTPDLYVVVDELDELGCRLTVDAWPAVDADGRLVFADTTRLVTVRPARLHAALSEARARAGEPAPHRPLRIGDVLAVWRGPLADQLLGPDVGETTAGPVELVDVTSDARRVTNAAALAAAGDVLTRADLAAFGLEDGLDDQRDADPDTDPDTDPGADPGAAADGAADGADDTTDDDPDQGWWT